MIVPMFVSAQTLVKEVESTDTRFIPGQYMKNGEAAIYFSDNEYSYSDGEYTHKAQIYDFELNPLKSFEFATLTPFTVIEEREAEGIIEKTKTLTKETGVVTGMPPVSDMESRKEAFINYFYEANCYFDANLTLENIRDNCRIEGDMVLILVSNLSANLTSPYQYYLSSAESYLNKDNQTGYIFNYAITVNKYSGEWTSRTRYESQTVNFLTPKCTDVAKMNHWNGGVYLPFSQTFFNDDEKFEYVRYKAELSEGAGDNMAISPGGYESPLEILFGITSTDRDGDGEDDMRSTHYGIHYTGIEVITEDGEVIHSFPLPDEFTERAAIEFFKSDNSILAQLSFYGYNDNNEYLKILRFYRIDKASGIAEIVKEERHIAAYPNPASKGTTITLDLSDNSRSSRIIYVTDLNGVNVYRQKVDAGASTATIPTEGLTSGVYIVSVTENDRVSETCKIIIR